MKKVNSYTAKNTQGILLNANESNINISEAAIKKIQEAILSIPFHRYPDDESKPLIDAYAQYIQKDAGCIIAGNGSDEMLGMMIGITVSEGKTLYTLAPDFSMYDYYTSMYHGDILKYPYAVDNEFDVDAFIAMGKKNSVALIVFSNPNNPTGKTISQKDIIKIIEAFPDIYVIVDEAYAEFDECTMLDHIDLYPNLLITRTLSKAFALAGIRCGFLIGSKDTINKLKPYKVPYNVNRLTQMVGTIVLQQIDEIKTNIEKVKAEREAFYQSYLALDCQDVTLYPSKANYLYGKATHKTAFLEALKAKNITIRNYEDDSFRITVGTKEQNQLILDILKDF